MSDGAGRTLDIHTHAMPMPLLAWLAGNGRADLSAVAADVVRLDPLVSGVAEGAPLPLTRSQYDVEARITEMDAAGVDVQAVSLPPFLFCSTCADEALVVEVIRRGNDELARFAAQRPDRLVALGSVPLGTDAATGEAIRCLDELGMHGLAIGTRGAGRDLDDAINEPLWTLMQERQTFVFLHPSGVPDPTRMTDFWLPQLVGYPMETALAGARLAFGGVLERHPFPLCLAHGGGCLPWLRGRFDLGWTNKAVAHTTSLPPSRYLLDLYLDTAVFSAEILGHLVNDYGSDRILMGTDFPFELGDRDPIGTVAALGLSESEAAKLRGETAWRLLGMDVPPTA